jgi:hypothetical protein
MPITKGNIIVGAGILKIGPYGGTTTDVGATRDGVEIEVSRDFHDTKVDQFPATLMKTETDRKITIKANLLEATLANLAIAWGYPASAVSSGTFSLGIPSSTEEKKIEFVGKAPNGGTRTATFWRCVAVSGGGVKYVKDGEVVIPVQFEVLYDPSAPSGQEFGKIVDS